MTVRNELDRAIAMAEASKGSYLLFAVDSEDQKATQVFQDMAGDMDRHVQILKSRRDYLDQYNPLNAAGQNGDDKQQGAKGKNGKEGSN
jgi:rubrerythrin